VCSSDLAKAQENIRRTKALTEKPFAVNLFIPEPVADFDSDLMRPMEQYLNALRQKLGLPHKNISDISLEEPELDEWIKMLIRERIAAVSFTFGSLSFDQVQLLKRNNIFIMGTATSVAEAIHLQKTGCDAIVAQGYEAGGHRGTFFHHKSDPLGTMALIPQVVDAVNGLPVIAAGGICDGRGMFAAQALGATAFQLGTVFIPADESCASKMHKEAILTMAQSTRLTKSISGKSARAISNEWIDELEKMPELPYPLQHYLTREIRQLAAQQNNSVLSTFWSGQAAPLARAGSAKEIMTRLNEEYQQARQSMCLTL
jgi:nitronate monooxygenase